VKGAAVFLGSERLPVTYADAGRWKGHRHPNVQAREGWFVLPEDRRGDLTGRRVAVRDGAGEWFLAVVTGRVAIGHYVFVSEGGPLP
jgi:hypothetical protein